MRNLLSLLFLVAIPLAYAEPPCITRFSHDGVFAWTNCATNAGARIEHCADLLSASISNWTALAVARKTDSVVLHAPAETRFYRLVQTDTPPTVQHKVLDRVVGWDDISWTYSLDMDDDGLFDLTFDLVIMVGCGTDYYTKCTVWRYDSDPWHSDPGDYVSHTRFHREPRERQEVLSGSLAQWREDIAGLYYYLPSNLVKTTEGPWFDVKDSYLPVSLVRTSGVHSGWVRMSVVYTNVTLPEHGITNFPTFHWTLHDCAFETVPDRGIVAGQTE